MNFFEHQERARKRTGLLVFLFLLAVAGIVLCVYLAALAVFYYTLSSSSETGAVPVFEWWMPDIFLVTASAVLTVVLAGTLYRTMSLREGGTAVARMLGGRRILPETTDPEERRVLNVVEEMAIASGVPVPPVYLLEDEAGINAFAAGFSQSDAVIGVTRGAVKILSRDEMQGVIAHEFSHILNGDMGLNLRLIGVLHGILVLTMMGRMVLRIRMRRSSGKGGGAIVAIYAFGLLLWLIGSIGVLFGRMIQCAVSREREHLADASAVQFTRNPGGLAGALKKIGGLTQHGHLETPQAESASHLFFAEGIRSSFAGLFATHPPLETRVRLLDPAFNGKFPAVEIPVSAAAPARKTAVPRAAKAAAYVRPQAPAYSEGPAVPVSQLIGTLTEADLAYAADLMSGMPGELVEAAREPVGSRALILALLLSHDNKAREAQLRYLFASTNNFVYQRLRQIEPKVRTCPREMWMPLLELSLPAASLMPEKQYGIFRGNIDDLISHDLRLDLFEMTVRQVVVHYLDAKFKRRPLGEIRYRTPAEVKIQAKLLLTALARAGASDDESAARAFEAAWKLFSEQGGAEPMDQGNPAPKQIEADLQALGLAAPAVKQKFIDAAAAAAQCDGKVGMGETELLRAFSSALDCPLPAGAIRPAA